MRVIFIHGPAAAGKYTIGSILSRRLGIPLFHNHLTVDLVGSLFEFGTPGFIELREEIWLRSFQQAAKADRSFIFTFHPEATVAENTVQRLQTCIEENGGQVQYIQLTCSDTEVLQRIGNKSRQEFGKLSDPELYKQLRDDGAFEFPPLPTASLCLDTDLLSAEEAANQIVQELRN